MVLPTETKAFLLSRPAQPGPRRVHSSGRVNHQTWLCPHKACCRPPCLPPGPTPCISCASVQHLSPAFPSAPFTSALLSLPCSLILRFLHAPSFPHLPILSSGPATSAWCLHLCATYMPFFSMNLPQSWLDSGPPLRTPARVLAPTSTHRCGSSLQPAAL